MKKIFWALFGNDEDGIYGSGTKFNPGKVETPWMAIKWWFRNPFHNFTHHVIGIYGEKFVSQTIYENTPGWSKSIRILRTKTYPYWNFVGDGFQFYFGWRDSGAFGIALRRRKAK